jgi:hypothetical protein
VGDDVDGEEEEENEVEGKENEPVEQGDEEEKMKEEEEEEMVEGDDEEEDEPIAEENEEEPIKIKEEIEEPPNEGEENDNIVFKEDKPIKEEKKKEEGEEESMEVEGIEANPFANSREETLKLKLENATEKVYKWMAGIEPNEIGGTIGEWDNLSLLKMVEMADQEIREDPQKFIFIINICNLFKFRLNLWLPWLKCAIPKCLPQIEGVRNRRKLNKTKQIKLNYCFTSSMCVSRI